MKPHTKPNVIFSHNENRKFHIAETGSKRELLINKILLENVQISLDLHLFNLSRVLSIDARHNPKSTVQRTALAQIPTLLSLVLQVAGVSPSVL